MRFIWLALGVLSLVTGAYLVYNKSEVNEVTQPVQGTSATLTWRVGTLQKYTVEVNSSMDMQADAQLQVPALEVDIAGTLTLRTLEVDNNSALAGFRFSDVNMAVAGSSDDAVNQALQQPFRVRYSLTGAPVSFEFPTSVIAEHRLIIENLIRMFQVNLQIGETWLVEEQSPLGRYEAQYERVSPTQIKKSKRGFIGSREQPMLTGATITSTETVEIDRQRDWIHKMTSAETLVTNNNAGPALTITNKSTLSLVASGTTTEKTEPVDTWAFITAPPPRPEINNDLSDTTLTPEEAERQLRLKINTLQQTADGRIRVIHRLRDLLMVNALQPEILLQNMQRLKLSDRTRADLYLALELAGTNEAQSALVSIILSDAWDHRDTVRAIVALGGVADPQQETINALWQVVQTDYENDVYQLSSTATFALGSLGKTMNQSKDAGYPDLQTRLMDGAMAGATSQTRVNHIHALGNTQDATMAPDLVILMQDKSPSIRKATALSLNAMGADSVASQLITLLPNESNGSVRGAIAEALAGWTTPDQNAITIVTSLMFSEKDENARLNMARFLGANLKAFPDNEISLRQLLRVEPSKHIRQTIAEMLAENS